MLQRVLEPEVMDTLEEALVYDAMNHDEVNRQFVSDLIEAGLVRGDVLDLGTGTALIPIELCKQMVDVRVMAIDLSENMLNMARNNIELGGATERIQLDRVDAKSMPYGDGSFDCVMSNSIVHHLPDPVAALTESVRVVRGGGLLFFRDLVRPREDKTVRELVDTYATDEPPHARQLFADSLRAALTLDEVQCMVQDLGFDPESVRMTSDRHWTWVGRKN